MATLVVTMDHKEIVFHSSALKNERINEQPIKNTCVDQNLVQLFNEDSLNVVALQAFWELFQGSATVIMTHHKRALYPYDIKYRLTSEHNFQ